MLFCSPPPKPSSPWPSPKPSPPPPPPSCTQAPTIRVITGTYGVLNFDITPPTGVTDVSITLSCQQTGSSVPVSGQHVVAASFPATSVQAPNIGPDASCTVVADTALASGSKCPSSQPLGITTPPSAAYAPGVGQFVPTGIDTATFSVVPPVNITNPIVTYIVTAVPTQPLGGASFSTNVTAPGTNGTLTGFQVNTHYNITVVAVYNDGSVSPTGTVPLVIFPCSPIPGCTWQDTTCEKGPSVCSKCSGANFNSTSVDGTCACDSGYQLVGNACSALPSPPPPSPPAPPISPITVKATFPSVWHIDTNKMRSVYPIQIKNNTGGTLFAPGCYSMSYVTGCMQYGVPIGSTLDWRLNLEFPDHGWYFGAKPATDPTLCKSSTCSGSWDIHCATSCLPKTPTGTPLPGPATSNITMTLDQCEQWNKNSTPAQYMITGAPSEIFVWLRDQSPNLPLGEEANDNGMYRGNEPTWVLTSCSA